VEDAWRGATEGTRDYTRRVVEAPDDWLRLPVLDPFADVLGKQLTCLRLVCGELQAQVPVIQTIFNPLAQAKNLCGGQILLAHLRRYPEAVHAGLRTIAESTRRFVEAACETGIAGIFYAVQHANYPLLSQQEYDLFGRAYDLQVLEPAGGLWLNMLHLHGEEVMFERFIDYPIAIINGMIAIPPRPGCRKLFKGALCGGLQRGARWCWGRRSRLRLKRTMRSWRPAAAFILGTGCAADHCAARQYLGRAAQRGGGAFSMIRQARCQVDGSG
jgi:uroporphyrinogen decarboxylase